MADNVKHDLWIYLLTLECLVSAVTAASENIALSKPVSSSHNDYGGVPERGNDGNDNPVYSGNSCVYGERTRTDPLPWWQINLQSQYCVEVIAVTNRADAFQWRLHNFTISVYTEDPSTTPTAVAKVCAVYPGTVGSGVREVLPCGSRVRGQYLRLHKNELLHKDALQFCELEIYATESSLDFDTSLSTVSFFSKNPSLRLEGTPLREHVETPTQCGSLCHQIPRCFGFNFQAGKDSSMGHCQLMSNLGSDPVDDPTWAWYDKRC
ncbi:fucolectin-1-like [Haliotis rubra]|uniref:fucolectin-1-like n=1 Tax=Haliotis rubra TaxID=36100 RepID=UPI001EE5519C|nr:fucolectin-1-like [Haliotis rubra]